MNAISHRRRPLTARAPSPGAALVIVACALAACDASTTELAAGDDGSGGSAAEGGTASGGSESTGGSPTATSSASGAGGSGASTSDAATSTGSATSGAGEGGAGDSTGGAGGGGVGGGAEMDPRSVASHPGETDHAELVETLPVGRTAEDAKRRVVLRLKPAQIPDLAVGDRLITPAELEVTTRCDVGQAAPGCDYNPQVRAQIILTGNEDDVDAAGNGSHALSEPQTQSCTRADHHCMIVFRPGDATNVLEDALALPCVLEDRCWVNVVAWAWHPDARPGDQDVVLVGSNEGNYLDNGIVEGDQARLMVVRERGVTAADREERETTENGQLTVPTNADSTLVYSHRLTAGDQGLRAGENHLVEAKLVADVDDRARVSTLMFLSKNPDARDGNGIDATFPRAINEHNGINCTAGTTPCTLHKVGVFRVEEDVEGPVFVQVIVRSAVPGGGTTGVRIRRDDGWARSTRWDASLAE